MVLATLWEISDKDLDRLCLRLWELLCAPDAPDDPSAESVQAAVLATPRRH